MSISTSWSCQLDKQFLLASLPSSLVRRNIASGFLVLQKHKQHRKSTSSHLHLYFLLKRRERENCSPSNWCGFTLPLQLLGWNSRFWVSSCDNLVVTKMGSAFSCSLELMAMASLCMRELTSPLLIRVRRVWRLKSLQTKSESEKRLVLTLR